jgi:positive regulator of sigma E activity
VPGGPLVPIITIGLIAWLLTSITQAEWTVLLITLGVATGFYLVAARGGKPTT